jgi:hypothetical protein
MLKSILAYSALQRFSCALDEPNASLRRDAFDLKRPRVRESIPNCFIALFILSLGVGLYAEYAATAAMKS